MTRVEAALHEAAYFADPALSASGAKRLLPPSCPALYRYDRDHGQAPRPEFDFGHAAHSLVLGVGADTHVVDAADWRTKAAQQARDEARAAGLVPLLRADADRVTAMADAIRSHPIAGPLFTPGTGTPEQSVFWDDAATGVPRKARIDWVRPNTSGSRVILADLKTTTDCHPAAISKTVANFSYHVQAAFYRDAAAAAGWDEDAVFLFVFVSKAPPHLVTVVEMDSLALSVGEALVRRAVDVYAECTAADCWPGFSDDIELVGLPSWALNPAALDVEVSL